MTKETREKERWKESQKRVLCLLDSHKSFEYPKEEEEEGSGEPGKDAMIEPLP
jgi:hypothetical protein